MDWSVSKNSRYLRGIKKMYNNQLQVWRDHNITPRTIRIPRHKANWVLLEEGLDVIWDGIENDIRTLIGISGSDYDMIDVLTNANISKLDLSFSWCRRVNYDRLIPIINKLSNKGTNVNISSQRLNRQLIIQLRDAGANVSIIIADNIGDNNPLIDRYIIQCIKDGIEVILEKIDIGIDPNILESIKQSPIQLPQLTIGNSNLYSLGRSINAFINLRDQSIVVPWSGNNIFIEFLIFTRTKYELKYDMYTSSQPLSYPILVNQLDNVNIINLFRYSCARGHSENVRYILQSGYIPKFNEEDYKRIDEHILIIILEEIKLDTDNKYELYKNYMNYNSYVKHLHRLSYNILTSHPTVINYWNRLIFGINIHRAQPLIEEDLTDTYSQNEIDQLHCIERNVPKIRELLMSDRIFKNDELIMDTPASACYNIITSASDLISECQRRQLFEKLVNRDHELTYCTNRQFSDLWSIIPTNNTNFLWFLYYNGIELPPPIDNTMCIPRLVDRDCNEGLFMLIHYGNDLYLLQYINAINLNVIQFRHLHPTLELLAQYQPRTMMKSARTKI